MKRRSKSQQRQRRTSSHMAPVPPKLGFSRRRVQRMRVLLLAASADEKNGGLLAPDFPFRARGVQPRTPFLLDRGDRQDRTLRRAAGRKRKGSSSRYPRALAREQTGSDLAPREVVRARACSCRPLASTALCTAFVCCALALRASNPRGIPVSAKTPSFARLAPAAGSSLPRRTRA